MGKETRASAVSLGTGFYDVSSDFRRVVFNCTNTSRKKSETKTALPSTCLQNTFANEDRGRASSLPLTKSTFFGAESPQQYLNTLGARIESTPPAWSDNCVNRTSELWGLSLIERTDLKELGIRLQDIGEHSKNNPADVVRFLIANSGNVPSAEKKFREMVVWRKQHNVDKILLDNHPPQHLVAYYPGAVLRGLDHDGDPIFLSRLGVTDAAGMLERYGRNEMINHAIWLRELLCTGQWIKEYERVHNKPVKRALVIEDVHGIQLLQIACNRPLLSLYSEIMRLDQDNFPEAAKKIIVLRAPALFHIIWNVVQHFFDANVREKMIFTTRNNYIEILSQHMDISVLPPCIAPELGKGGALDGMPSNFEGGRLPLIL